jgi:hypothetical protein
MNETEIRDRLRDAVGEARYPVFLTGRIQARLKGQLVDTGSRESARRNRSPWLAGARHTGSLAAAVLLMLLIAALAIGVHEWRNGVLFNRPEPAGGDPTVARYQALVSRDNQKLSDAAAYLGCITYTDLNCVPANTAEIAVLQRWLSDLEGSQPPARFAFIDAVMRRHLAHLISADRAFIAAFQARDDTAVGKANDAYILEIDPLHREAEDVVASSPRTTNEYITAVRSNTTYLFSCVVCQRLVGQDSVSCQASQRPSCSDEIATVRLQLESSLSDLAWGSAPANLATPATRLQTDLLTADMTLDSVDSALSAGDQVGLQTALDLVDAALDRVRTDAAAIESIS